MSKGKTLLKLAGMAAGVVGVLSLQKRKQEQELLMDKLEYTDEAKNTVLINNNIERTEAEALQQKLAAQRLLDEARAREQRIK